MGSLADHESNNLVKMLVAADSGSGKTGALASLVDAGLRLHILDFDNGLSPLKNYIKDKSKLGNVQYETLQDELQLVGGKFIIKKAAAFQRAMELFDKGHADWGPAVKTMGPGDVLVIDTLGKMSKASLLLVMFINGALAKNPEIQHYGVAMENIERMLGQITSAAVGCHVIVNTHLTKEEGSVKLYPEAIGSKLNPKIARDFDNFFSISVSGTKRTIKTQRDGQLALKCAKPLQAEFDIDDGYAKIFRELTGVKDLATLGKPKES
jgi:hypothetical protein